MIPQFIWRQLMATTKSISAKSVKNIGGTAKQIGSSSTVLVSSNLGLNTVATGSVVVDGDDTNKAVNLGVFAYNNQAPVAKRLTSSLATVSNSVLLSGAAAPELMRNVHRIESVLTRRQATAIRNGQFNIYTGTFTVTPSVALDTFHKAVSGATYVDKVANVDPNNPGVAVYRTGSKIPVVNAY